MKLFCVFEGVLLLLVLVKANNTFTYDMALRCKEHVCNGYNYEQFYRVDAVRGRPSEPDVLFELHIAILAASNGHILLSSAPKVSANDPVYEIVVGGGANKFTELRRNIRKNARASSKTLGILSAIEFRPFYIKVTEDGEIKFGKEGDLLPVISYTDNDPIPISYFSFAAWNGVEAKFLYDCPTSGLNASKVPDSQEVQRNISNYDMLVSTLLRYRDPSVPPAPEVTVDTGLHVTSFSFDELESTFSVGVSILLRWMDDSLAWNPTKFNGTTYLSLRQGQIWSPILYVFDDISGSGPAYSEHVTVLHSGQAALHAQLFIKSWCSADNDTGARWPQDIYLCAIILEPWEVHDKVHLKVLDDTNREMKAFSDIQEVVVNAWQISVKPLVIDARDWNEMFTVEESFTTVHSDKLIVDMTLTRRSAAYSIILYTPLIVLVTFLLLSFWTEPLHVARIQLYTVCALVICVGLCYIDYILPCHTVPSILVLYVTVLGGIMFALIIQVAMMTTLAAKLCKSVVIQDILMQRFLRNLFCLQESKANPIYVSINEGFTAQEDEGSVLSHVVVEEMQREARDIPEQAEVAEVFDKLLFVVYSITFAVLLILY